MLEKKKSDEQIKKDNAAAERIAEHDIEMDPDLSMEPEPGDDLDEGELANFENKDEEE